MLTSAPTAIAAWYYPNPAHASEGGAEASAAEGGESAPHRLLRMMFR